jgi:phosphate-selective porin OprO/OprP
MLSWVRCTCSWMTFVASVLLAPTIVTAQVVAPTPLPAVVTEAAKSPEVADLEKRLAAIEQELAKAKKADDPLKPVPAAGGPFTVKPMGRVHTDMVSISQDADNKALFGDLANGAEIRRARLGAFGEGWEVLAYRFDVDFVTRDANTLERPTIFDAYLDVLHLPVIGNLRVGHFREPFSMERLDSSNDQPFLERSTAILALTPFRNLGVMAFNCNEAKTGTFAIGAFREATNEFGEDIGDNGGQAVTSRAAWLPYYDEPAQGRYLTHLGASYSYRNPNVKTRRFAQTPEVNLRQGLLTFPAFVDTGLIATESFQNLAAEWSTVWGPFSAQAEYVGTFVDQLGNPNLYLHGAYAQLTYFLTGENRNYNRDLGIYQGVAPYTNFFCVDGVRGLCLGRGAWEAVARYSWIDLRSQNINGGELTNVTFGLNWYFATRNRLMFNYIHAFLDRGLYSNADIFSTRLQVNF